MVDKKYIGKRIQRARLEMGFTQKDFSKKFGVNITTLANWERGEIENISRILELSEFTGKDPAWFFTEEEQPTTMTKDERKYFFKKVLQIEEMLEEMKKTKK